MGSLTAQSDTIAKIQQQAHNAPAADQKARRYGLSIEAIETYTNGCQN